MVLALVIAAAPFELELQGCDGVVARERLVQLVQVEWPTAPAGTRLVLGCAGEEWPLELHVPGRPTRRDTLNVSTAGSPDERERLAALLVAERGSALMARAAPLRAVGTPDASLAVTPTPVTRTAARDGVWGLSDERGAQWRLGAGATGLASTLGSLRAGARALAQWRFVGLGLSATFGGVAEKYALRVFAVEPELTLASLRWGRWAVFGALRVQAGIAVLEPVVVPPQVSPSAAPSVDQALLLGGAGVVGVSVDLTRWLALELELQVGGAGLIGAATWQVPGVFEGAVVGVALTACVGWPP